MCNAHLYTHACIYKPFFLIKVMILKDVLPGKVFISECVCLGVWCVHACLHVCTCITAEWMSGVVSLSPILDPGIEPSPSGSQSKIFCSLNTLIDPFFF